MRPHRRVAFALLAGSLGGCGGGSSPAAPDGSDGPDAAPPPPALSGQHFLGDFSSARDDEELHSMVNVVTRGNVHAEPGVGMRYDFQPRPGRCNDQTLAAHVALPAGTRQVWMRFRIRFSTNWTTVNPNCSSPSPAYKTVLTWLSGIRDRFDFNTANGRYIHASVPGYAAHDAVPVGVVQPGRGAVRAKMFAQHLWDGEWHTVELHEQLASDDEALIQVRIDGVITHNYRTKTTPGLSSVSLQRINIGGNRNLGATELMQVWWDDFEVWLSDPGMEFPPPSIY